MKKIPRIKELRKICQPKDEHPVYKACRLISIYFTKIFLFFGFKPNQITVLGFFCGLVGGFLFIKEYFLAGILFFILFRIFDDVDGEVARFLKKSSSFGAWLDTLSGHLIYPYFFFTLGLGVYLQEGLFLYFFCGSLAAILKLIERSVPSVSIPRQADDSQKKKKSRFDDFKEWIGYTSKFIILFLIALVFIIFDRQAFYLILIAFYLSLIVFLKLAMIGRRACC